MTEIVLDLPAPISVNRTRRVDWSQRPLVKAWIRSANAIVLAQGKLPNRITGHYEATVVLPHSCRLDADNGLKLVLDYAKRIALVEDDSPRFLRRLVVEFGEAPEGCRLILRKLTPEGFVTIGEAASEVVSRLAEEMRTT